MRRVRSRRKWETRETHSGRRIGLMDNEQLLEEKDFFASRRRDSLWTNEGVGLAEFA